MNGDLLIIFNNINDWLKFAENKNFLLTAFLGVLSVCSFIFEQTITLSKFQIILTTISFSCFVFVLIIIIISFYPKINIDEKKLFRSKNYRNSDRNLLFYGDIAKYSLNEYIGALGIKYNIENMDNINIDLVSQIFINSIITKWKFNCFKIAASILGVGILSIFIEIIFIFWG